MKKNLIIITISLAVFDTTIKGPFEVELSAELEIK